MKSVTITPTISVLAAGLACTTVAGSTTVTSSALFGSVVAGQFVYGPGIPLGTKVASKTSSSSITLDTAAKSGGSVTLQFGYFTADAYTAGDTLGFLFEIPLNRIDHIFVVDKAKQITAVKMYVFSSLPATLPLDNATFAPNDADAMKLIGYYSLTGTVPLGNNHVIFPADAELPLAKVSGQKMYGVLVCVGTPTFATINDIGVNISGE